MSSLSRLHRDLLMASYADGLDYEKTHTLVYGDALNLGSDIATVIVYT